MTVKVKKFGHVYSGEIVKRGVRRALVRFKTKRGVEKQCSLPIVRTEREFDLLCTGCVLIAWDDAPGTVTVNDSVRVTIPAKHCARCSDADAKWRCRMCGALCCQHVCRHKGSDGSCNCGGCVQRNAGVL